MAKKSTSQTILWWIVWIFLTIASFFVAAWIWTPFIASHFGTMNQSNAAIMWVIAVFGTWMIFLVPLIVFMYSKVDKAYEDARINREKAALRFRSEEVPQEARILPSQFREKLRDKPETIKDGHVIKVTLKDGQAYDYVFVQNRSEILGIYDERKFPFQVEEIIEIDLVLPENLPAFEQNRWLRLDGVASPE